MENQSDSHNDSVKRWSEKKAIENLCLFHEAHVTQLENVTLGTSGGGSRGGGANGWWRLCFFFVLTTLLSTAP